MLNRYNISCCSQEKLSRIPHTSYVVKKTFLKNGDEISVCENRGSTKYYRNNSGNISRISSEKYDTLNKEENIEATLKKGVVVIPYEGKDYKVNFYDSPYSRDFWGDTQIMEIERMEGEPVTFPPFFSVYWDVTDEKIWDERTLALNDMAVPETDDETYGDLVKTREANIRSIMQTVRTYPEAYIRNAAINIGMGTMQYDEEEVIDEVNADDIENIIYFVSDTILCYLDDDSLHGEISSRDIDCAMLWLGYDVSCDSCKDIVSELSEEWGYERLWAIDEVVEGLSRLNNIETRIAWPMNAQTIKDIIDKMAEKILNCRKLQINAPGIDPDTCERYNWVKKTFQMFICPEIGDPRTFDREDIEKIRETLTWLFDGSNELIRILNSYCDRAYRELSFKRIYALILLLDMRMRDIIKDTLYDGKKDVSADALYKYIEETRESLPDGNIGSYIETFDAFDDNLIVSELAGLWYENEDEKALTCFNEILNDRRAVYTGKSMTKYEELVWSRDEARSILETTYVESAKTGVFCFDREALESARYIAEHSSSLSDDEKKMILEWMTEYPTACLAESTMMAVKFFGAIDTYLPVKDKEKEKEELLERLSW